MSNTKNSERRRAMLMEAIGGLSNKQVLSAGLTVTHRFVPVGLSPTAKGEWQAGHDHDPEMSNGHVTLVTAPTWKEALETCAVQALKWDEAQRIGEGEEP